MYPRRLRHLSLRARRKVIAGTGERADPDITGRGNQEQAAQRFRRPDEVNQIPRPTACEDLRAEMSEASVSTAAAAAVARVRTSSSNSIGRSAHRKRASLSSCARRLRAWTGWLRELHVCGITRAAARYSLRWKPLGKKCTESGAGAGARGFCAGQSYLRINFRTAKFSFGTHDRPRENSGRSDGGGERVMGKEKRAETHG
jgi:hypothetical protein